MDPQPNVKKTCVVSCFESNLQERVCKKTYWMMEYYREQRERWRSSCGKSSKKKFGVS